MAALLAGLASGGGAPKLYAEDVFLVNTRTGTGATANITGGPNLATYGGMVHIKSRNNATTHTIHSATAGVTKRLRGENTDGETTVANLVTAFTSDGFTLGTDAGNSGGNFNSSYTYVDWVWRNARNFFKETTVTKSSGSNATVDLSSLGTVGMVRVKRTDAAGSWYVWHRSLSAGKLLIGETTAAEATLGHITVSGTTLTLVNGVIADGTYHSEAYAHDTSADGLIQCGSFTTDGSGNATVNLGWEPQYLMIKGSTIVEGWYVNDVARRMSLTQYGFLFANKSDAEYTGTLPYFMPNATGFSVANQTVGTYIYLAIRRSNKPPTSGTQVYNAIARTGTGAAATVSGVGFAPDLAILKHRNAGLGYSGAVYDRLRGGQKRLAADTTQGESSETNGLQTFGMEGVAVGAGNEINESGTNYINHFFRRAPGVMDIVCYTGTGVAHTEAHGLGVVPELMIVKGRSLARNWIVGTQFSASSMLGGYLNTADGLGAGYGGTISEQPSASNISLGTSDFVNGNSATYVAYLFASKSGISKIFSFTGNGTSQTINCGFAAGARFVLVKRVDAAGDWYVWDSVRGIVAGADPHLSLNTTAAEVTTDDSVDPASEGFICNQNTATNINVNNAMYIGLAIA